VRCGTAERGADAGDELRHLEGLGDVVVGAGLEPDDDVDRVGPGGEHHDRHRRGGADRPAHLEPVEAGQHHVEHDRVRPLGAEAGEALVAGRGGEHLEAGGGEAAGRELTDRRVVLDEQDAGVHAVSISAVPSHSLV
jgi:hypothetical protein